MPRSTDDPRGLRNSRPGRLIRHLDQGHDFGLESHEHTDEELETALDEVHEDQHAQLEQFGLPNHPHSVEIVDLNGNMVGKSPNENSAKHQILRRFGPDGGKEYVVRKSV